MSREPPVQTARHQAVGAMFDLNVFAYNLIRLGKLLKSAMGSA
jgi:hypothetical protein